MAKQLAGGLLRGFGDALVRRAEVEREDVLIARQNAIERAREIRQDLMRGNERAEDRADRIASDTADRTSRENESRAEREARESEVVDVVPTESGNDQIVLRGGKTREGGFRSRSTSRSSADDDKGGISPEDQRQIDLIAPQYTTTTTDELTGKETKVTDWKAVAAHLRRMPTPRTDLADMLEGTNPSRREATTHARRPADVAGRSGSRSNPARPANQEEFDALPSGAIYVEDDGKLYRKP